MDDGQFLAHARRHGFPLEPQLRRCAELQAEARAAGRAATLFELARQHGILSDARALELLAAVPSVAPATAPSTTPSRRVALATTVTMPANAPPMPLPIEPPASVAPATSTTPSKRVAAAAAGSVTPSKRVVAAPPKMPTPPRAAPRPPRPKVAAVFKSSAVRMAARVRGQELPEETLSPVEQRLRAVLGVLCVGALLVLLGLGVAVAVRRPSVPASAVEVAATSSAGPTGPTTAGPDMPVAVIGSDATAPPTTPSPSPSTTPSTAAIAPESSDVAVAPVSSGDGIAADSSCDLSGVTASVALELARDLVRQGREPSAVDRLDEALAGLTAPALRRPLEVERADILRAVDARMLLEFGFAEQAAKKGDTAKAKAILDALYPHVPAALGAKRRALYDKLVLALNAAPEAKPGEPRPDAPKTPAAAAAAAKALELERVLAARRRIDDALAVLDVPTASAAVLGDVKEKDLALEARNDAARVEAVSELLGFVRSALDWDATNQKEVALELKKGGPLRATIRKVSSDRIVVRVAFKGEREVKLIDLTVAFLCDTARRAAGENKKAAYSFGAGALLAVAGELDPALVELSRAREIPQAVLLRLRLEKERALAGLPAKDDRKAASFGDRQKRLEELRVEGRWRVARACKRYDILSNGPEAEVRELALAMDLMCDEYIRLFAPKQEPPVFSIRLYHDRTEFIRETGSAPTLLGFYDGDKIVSYHQDAIEKTRTTLFHEGAHQFEGLVWGKNLWSAPIWFVEGLAVYFEASRIEGARLATDQISRTHLAAVQRSLKVKDDIPLSTLIRVKQSDFVFTHYAHAWSLIYFLVQGTEGGLERIRKYFDGMREGKDGVKLFEELFNRPMSQIEDAWKAYVKEQK